MSYFFKVNEVTPRQTWYTTPKFSPNKSQQVSAWLSLKTDATVNYYYTKQLEEVKSLNITYQTLTTKNAGLVGGTMLSNKKPPTFITQYLSLLLNTSSQLTDLYKVNIYLVLRQCLR